MFVLLTYIGVIIQVAQFAFLSGFDVMASYLSLLVFMEQYLQFNSISILMSFEYIASHTIWLYFVNLNS